MQGRGEAATMKTTGFLSGWNGFIMGIKLVIGVFGPRQITKEG